MNRKNHCELGITSMPEYSCTRRDGRLDSVFDDAPEAPRGVAERNFRSEKKSAYIFPEGAFEANPTCATTPKPRESVPADSQTRALGSILQALDEAPRRSSPC
jgi:hypothetical protein